MGFCQPVKINLRAGAYPGNEMGGCTSCSIPHSALPFPPPLPRGLMQVFKQLLIMKKNYLKWRKKLLWLVAIKKISKTIFLEGASAPPLTLPMPSCSPVDCYVLTISWNWCVSPQETILGIHIHYLSDTKSGACSCVPQQLSASMA